MPASHAEVLTQPPQWSDAERPTINAPELSTKLIDVKPIEWKHPEQLKKAIRLRDWVVSQMMQEQALVGIVARQGPWTTRFIEPTGLTHMGIVFQSPTTGEWITYSLYSNPATQRKTALIWQQSLTDFFYGQRGNGKQAMLLLPAQAMQQAWLAKLSGGRWQSLLPATHHYNLVAPVNNVNSYNCTKWLALQYLNATAPDSESLPQLTQRLSAQYVQVQAPRTIQGPLRLALRRKPDVIWQELSPPNTVQTITADGLYRSGWFEKRFLYRPLSRYFTRLN